MRTTSLAAAALAALALSACGGSDPAPGEPAQSSDQAAPAGGSAMPANWKATDACSILDKAAVAEVLKRPVPEATVAMVHEPGTADAGTSECSYLGEDGAPVATLMTRWSPINDNTAEAIAGAKATMNATLKGFGKGPVEDVAGLGKAAFIAPGTDQMSVYLDDARMFIISPTKLPDGANGKDIAVALARKAGA